MTSSTSGNSSEFRDYPFLTPDEFTEICHRLDRRYRQATLGPVRRRWRLSACTALSTAFALNAEYATFIQITRPLEGEHDDGDLSTCLSGFSFDPEPALGLDSVDDEKMETDEADDASAIGPFHICGSGSQRHRP